MVRRVDDNDAMDDNDDDDESGAVSIYNNEWT